ncbi:MAG: hypothetical protein R3B70_06110 [Polyangiaceae bacterium]
MRFPFRGAVLVCAALSLQASACGPVGNNPPPNIGVNEPLAPIAEVSDDAFATSLLRVLREGERTQERQGILAGVVRRQLGHAAKKFALGADGRGTASTVGALYLLRLGEGRGDLIDAQGAAALKGAMGTFGPRGDEGRALVLLTLHAAALPAESAERAEVEGHLRSLERWVLETRKGGPAENMGADERAKVARALLEPNEAAVAEAAEAIGVWLAQGVKYNAIFNSTGERPPREEIPETFRALRTAAPTLASLHLRYGDAKGAVASIDRFGARRYLGDGFYDRLRRAADSDGAHEWQALASILASAAVATDEDDEDALLLDPDLAEAGLWGTTLEAYRRDPAHFPTAALLATQLIHLGMSEAAPLVMSGTLGPKPHPQALGASMELLLAALEADSAADDLDACRRTYQAAGALLAAADAAPRAMDAGAERARLLMASIELRAGNLTAAKPLLESAAKAVPSVGLYTMLAAIERQSDNRAAALSHIDKALGAPDAKFAMLDLTDAYMLAFEIHRDGGDEAKARQALGSALATVLAVRKVATEMPMRLRAERLLAHVLGGFGDNEGAARAMGRAIDIAGADPEALSSTVLDAIGHAFVRRDLEMARSALRKGLDAGIRDEDLVYGGLWVQFLEREKKVTGDGTAEQALRRASGRGAWTGKLAAWASGKLSEADLTAAAQSAAQRIEAAFYTAIAKRAAGDPAGDTKLRDVAKSPVLELLEVQIAREMLAPRMRTDLPTGVKLP